MKIKSFVEIKPQPQDLRITGIICDFCQKEIKNKDYELNEVTISATLGSCYPEGDSRTIYEIDCCGDCFSNKVQPAIENTLNIEFRERGTDESELELAQFDKKRSCK